MRHSDDAAAALTTALEVLTAADPGHPGGNTDDTIDNVVLDDGTHVELLHFGGGRFRATFGTLDDGEPVGTPVTVNGVDYGGYAIVEPDDNGRYQVECHDGNPHLPNWGVYRAGGWPVQANEPTPSARKKLVEEVIPRVAAEAVEKAPEFAAKQQLAADRSDQATAHHALTDARRAVEKSLTKTAVDSPAGFGPAKNPARPSASLS